MKLRHFTLLLLLLNVSYPIKQNDVCSKCRPGWGVKKICTEFANTECEKCIDGDTYSSEFSNRSPCFKCSRCGVGLYEAHKCSGRRDTVCDDCTAVILKPEIKENMDFYNKCKYLYLKQNHTEVRKRNFRMLSKSKRTTKNSFP